MRFGHNVLRMTSKERFVQFSWKALCFSVLKIISDQFHDFENFNAHKCDLAKTCCAWPEKSVLYNFHKKAHFFPVLARILGQCDDFENFDAPKRDLMKTCCASPAKSVWYHFHGKRTVFPFSREFQASVTNLKTWTPKNTIWPKRSAHDLKRAFCRIFMESSLLSPFGENLSPVWRFWEFWRSQMRLGQNVLRMTWKERLYNFHDKRTIFPF